MGVVLSPDVVKDGHFPREGDHEASANLLLERFVDFRGSVTLWSKFRSSYMVHGSVAENEHNVTSDVDFCVINKGLATVATYERLRRELAEAKRGIQSNFNVAVDARVMSVDTLGSGREKDPLFVNYLASLVGEGSEEYERRWTSGDITPDLFSPYHLTLNPQLVLQSLVDYFANKYQTFLQPPADLIAAQKQVQRAHELPARGLSKIVQYMRLAGITGDGVRTEFSQASIFEEEDVDLLDIDSSDVLDLISGDDRKHFVTLMKRKRDGIRYLTSVADEEKGAFGKYKSWYDRSILDSVSRGVLASRALFELMKRFADNETAAS